MDEKVFFRSGKGDPIEPVSELASGGRLSFPSPLRERIVEDPEPLGKVRVKTFLT